MPELPEVETTLRGLAPYLEGQPLTQVLIRTPKLRLPTPKAELLTGRTVTRLTRRNKYILAELNDAHTLLLHLGMSGRLTITTQSEPLLKHDHIILTTPKAQIRLHDPRRFGLFLHIPTATIHQHPLLIGIGPEPLTPAFNPTYLHAALHGKTIPIKAAIMDGKLVAGVGNIYASESLFRAKIHPLTPAQNLAPAHCATLVACIQETLNDAITAGGSSLRDYAHSDGQLGYFQHSFRVYGRAGQPCLVCSTPIASQTVAQRNTFWCPHCQKLLRKKASS
jgi:formamidopyrimidine-DNA glycosylase